MKGTGQRVPVSRGADTVNSPAHVVRQGRTVPGTFRLCIGVDAGTAPKALQHVPLEDTRYRAAKRVERKSPTVLRSTVFGAPRGSSTAIPS